MNMDLRRELSLILKLSFYILKNMGEDNLNLPKYGSREERGKSYMP